MQNYQQITAEKQNLHLVFTNFWFIIPEYQRSYVWQEDNVNELLSDLWFAYEHKPDNEYFLGSLVLKQTTEKAFPEYEVLDGQQRLTTFYLLLACLRDIAQNRDLKEACSEKIYQKENKFKGLPERERIKYKIRDKVEDFFKQCIVRESGTLDAVMLYHHIRSNNTSLSNMAKVIKTIQGFLKVKTETELENFATYISLKPTFIHVSTASREDAFRMFTILNNRGIPLTSADILKSINVGEITDERERERYATVWETIESDLGDDFERFLSFLRLIITKERLHTNLLEDFEQVIYKKGLLQVGKQTIDVLRKYHRLYDDAIRLDETFEIDNSYRNLVTIMLIGFASTDWIPAVLYFYSKFGKTSLFTFLRKLEAKISGDWIVQETPQQRFEAVIRILKAIHQATQAQDVLKNNTLFRIDVNELREVLSGDIYGKRFTRYVLLKYEYLLSDNTVHLSDYNKITVEHILPQNPDKNSTWCKHFSIQERETLTHILGNLCLISRTKNSSLSNLDFQSKKTRYLANRIDIFKGSSIYIQQSKDWKPQDIRTRQAQMLDHLMKNW